MDSHIRYTHELISYNTKTYVKGQKNIKKRIKRDFERIDSIEKVILPDGQKAINVSGTVHLYGYKIENGGFFDLLNTRYYPEYYFFVRDAEIIEHSSSHMLKRKIKNN